MFVELACVCGPFWYLKHNKTCSVDMFSHGAFSNPSQNMCCPVSAALDSLLNISGCSDEPQLCAAFGVKGWRCNGWWHAPRLHSLGFNKPHCAHTGHIHVTPMHTSVQEHVCC